MRSLFAVIALCWVLAPLAAVAQSKQTPAPDRCLALARNAPPLLHKARLRLAALKPYQVRVTYNGHSTFTIETPKGVTIATDYNDYVRPGSTPTIVTMNVAHDTHFSHSPDPAIKHVLRGWNDKPDGAAKIHDLVELDVRVRNVPTNIRSSFGGPPSGIYGNSIFVFEVGGLCIAHLGHLHHTLTTQQLAQIGQMDIVFFPVDGSYTLDTPGMLEVLKSMKPRIVVPMHWFSGFSLEAFIAASKGAYEVVRNSDPTIVFSRDQMPAKQQLLIMPPGG
jgi:L-ascorbate metabolism protein UlaG (beta-lactamase superfamily)